MKWSEAYEQSGRTITVPVKLIHAIGAKGALFIAQLFFWKGKQKDDEGWIYKTKLELEEETGLSRWEQDKCVEDLKKKKIRETMYDRLDHRLYYRIHTDTLDAIMEADSPGESGKTTFGKAEKPLSGNPESHFGEVGKTAFGIKKQENTTEKTHKRNDDDDQSKLHAQLPATTPAVVVASSWPADDDESAQIVEKLTEKLQLSCDQSKTVQYYLGKDGKEYVLEKVQITRSKDLRNAAGFFIRALENDYREPVANKKQAPTKKKHVAPKSEEPEATDEERAKTSAKLREFIATLRATR
jgi:hypothetical protein